MRKLDTVQYQKNRTIALIEFPALQFKIAEGLGKKGIPFQLETRWVRNILTVRVVNEYFLEIPVTVDTVDRIVGLVPYFLHRPDLAHEEVPGIKRVKNYELAHIWTRTAQSFPSAHQP
jgi:hypothetical protein